MSKLLKLASIAGLTSSLGAAGYMYVVDRNGYHFKNATWKRVSDHVQGLLDRKSDIVVHARGQNAKDVVLRPWTETMKDMWNEQIRSGVDWVYSLGK
ncbi:LANO_0H01618g1_1 [Lachancea nothofagi CBS 11611]|uniref:MICOS complex subunit MIC12 n=1 Tax=Lachancea nothofagi CBS 11611 TaxID=1266666 RepID=A0A1G4KKT3_9SACH|nr:LANO_0H01618g1_1 [Lachancea nothofagi CBS 11611]